MSAYKEGSSWYAIVRIPDPVTGKSRQIKKRGFETKRAAKAWEAETLLEKKAKTSATFDEILIEQLRSIDSSETAFQMKTRWCRQHFPLHDRPIDSISRQELIDWRNSLIDGDLATRTRNRGVQYVKAAFDHAEKIYGLRNNAVVIKPFKLTKEDKEEKPVWTPEEFEKVASVAEPIYRELFTYLYWTGCRRGEALALCKEDIDGNVVHIHRAIKHFKNGFIPLKTDSSERYITIDSKTMEMLKPLIEHADPFVFGGSRSLPITQVDRYFKKAIKDAGVTPIRIHDLRHSHATWLLSQDVNIIAISKRLGHASINQTLKTYAHLLLKTNDEMMDVIEKYRNFVTKKLPSKEKTQ